MDSAGSSTIVMPVMGSFELCFLIKLDQNNFKIGKYQTYNRNCRIIRYVLNFDIQEFNVNFDTHVNDV